MKHIRPVSKAIAVEDLPGLIEGIISFANSILAIVSQLKQAP
jgi:hypothetical protein